MVNRRSSKVSPELDITMPLDTLANSFLHKRIVQIERPVYTEDDLSNLYCTNEKKNKEPLATRIKEKVKNYCSGACVVSVLLSLLPVVSWLPKYNFRTDLVRDLAAGLTLGIIQIPQGMAYGMLTTLPAIYGLYASFVPVFVYFAFGSSKHLNIGTFAIICLMVGEVTENSVAPLLPSLNTNGTTAAELKQKEVTLRVQYAVTTSFLVGLLQVAFGFFRFGFITIFLSDPLISGFTTGAAFHVFSSQVKHLVGMKIPRSETSGFFGLFKLYIYIFKNITSVNLGSFIIGVVAAILLYIIKYLAQKYKDKIKFPIPAELIVVILGTGLSYGVKFNEKFQVPILANVPTGMPPMTVPTFSKLGVMIVDCISIAIVSYAISVSVAKAFAKKNKYEIDANQELFAHGFVNIIGSFFSCHVASGSLSRSLIQENLGSTQLASVFSCVLILLTLTVLAPCFEPLPNAILAAIVLIALRGLFKQFSVLKALTKISKIDSFVWISSFIAVFCLGVDYGLAVGLILNLLTTVVRTSRPSVSVLAHVKQTEIYATVTEENETALEGIPGVKIFQFHAPLLYVNVDHFQTSLYKSTVNPAKCVTIDVPKCYQLPEKIAESTEDESTFYMEKIYTEAEQTTTEDNSETVTTVKAPLLAKETDPIDPPQPDMKCVTIPFDVSKTPTCPLHTIILDCAQISYADTMGIGILVAVCSEFKSLDVDVHLCNTPDALFELLDLGGFIEMHGSDNIFVSVHDAVQYSLAKQHLTGVCDPSMEGVNKDLTYEVVVVDGDVEEGEKVSDEITEGNKL